MAQQQDNDLLSLLSSMAGKKQQPSMGQNALNFAGGAVGQFQQRSDMAGQQYTYIPLFQSVIGGLVGMQEAKKKQAEAGIKELTAKAQMLNALVNLQNSQQAMNFDPNALNQPSQSQPGASGSQSQQPQYGQQQLSSVTVSPKGLSKTYQPSKPPLDAATLFNKYEQVSTPFVTVRDAFSRMESLKGVETPAGDLGYIFSYMKLLDPPSTIREGEQATAANAAAVPDRIRNMYNKVIKGEKLTPEQRKDFMERSKGLFKSAEMQQKKTYSEFSRLAKSGGYDPKQLFRDIGLSQSKFDNDFDVTPAGNRYKRK